MSMREYQMILQEMGLASPSSMKGDGRSGGGGGGTNNNDMGTIRVEHVLILRLDEKWEQLLAHAVAVLLKQSQKLVVPLKVIMYATSACLVLYGTAKLVESVATIHPTTITTTPSSSSSSSSNDANRPKGS